MARQARRWPRWSARPRAAPPDAPAVVAGDQRLTWAELDARRRPRRRRVRRPRAGAAATGSPSSCPTASTGCAPPWARCAPGWWSSRSTPPTPTRSSSTSSATPAPRCWSPRRSAQPRGRRPRSAPGRRTATARRRVPEDPAAPAFLPTPAARPGRPRGAILTAAALRANQQQCLAHDAAAGAHRRPGAAGAPAVPRLRPQRRLRAWSPRPGACAVLQEPSTRSAPSR